MNEPPPRLKHPSGWFAAGREVARALALLSDGAFKLYIHLCLNADRRTGRLSAEHGRLAKALRKSRRSVVTYLEELRRHGVCSIQAAVNQHLGGQIEICDAFWPYEKARSVGKDRYGGGLHRAAPAPAARTALRRERVYAGRRAAGRVVVRAERSDRGRRTCSAAGMCAKVCGPDQPSERRSQSLASAISRT